MRVAAVVVRALLLLGCLPLLHPPGVCACRAWAAVLPHHDCDHDHDGGCDTCPAAADTEPPRTADPTPDPADVSAPAVVVAWLGAPAVVPLLPARSSVVWPSTPPRFLSHCALVC